jgi:hypothetical protein
MELATENFLHSRSWKKALGVPPTIPETVPELHERYISAAMHMGLKSLQVLIPGGPERLKDDLDRIARGIVAPRDVRQKERLLDFAGDPWLRTPYVTLSSDLSFSLWSTWPSSQDCEPLKEAMHSPPQNVKKTSHRI